MIYDTVDRLPFYRPLLPALERIEGFLRRDDLGQLADGRHPIDGDSLFASIDSYTPHAPDLSHFEAHRHYIDLRILLAGGPELCGVSAPSSSLDITLPYDPVKDILFGRADHFSWLELSTTRFAIFFPNDAHLPGCRPIQDISGPLRKCVFKIKP